MTYLLHTSTTDGIIVIECADETEARKRLINEVLNLINSGKELSSSWASRAKGKGEVCFSDGEEHHLSIVEGGITVVAKSGTYSTDGVVGKLTVPAIGGKVEATTSLYPYRGVDVEYVPDGNDEERVSNYRALIETPDPETGAVPAVIVWANNYMEDYTHKFPMKMPDAPDSEEK